MNNEFSHFDDAMATELKQVKMFSHPDLPNGIGLIELYFLGGAVFVGIEDEYDTLLCSRTRSDSYDLYTFPCASSFWNSIVGRSLVGAWYMSNDRGYADAIQLRFRELPNDGPYTIIQLYGEASQITLSELKEVREASIRRMRKTKWPEESGSAVPA